jgi:transcriptional regulator with XRE-family HTH domain
MEFAGLLQQLRAEAQLTQEELAEAASLSLAASGNDGDGESCGVVAAYTPAFCRSPPGRTRTRSCYR